MIWRSRCSCRPKHALLEAGQQGLRPASDAPQEIHDFVRHAFEVNEGLRTQLKAAKENPLIYEVSITDLNGMVLVSTGRKHAGIISAAENGSVAAGTGENFLHQVKVLAGPSKVFELDFPFSNANQPFGEVRVALDSGILLKEIEPSPAHFGGPSWQLHWWFRRCWRRSISRATLAPAARHLRAIGPQSQQGNTTRLPRRVTGFGGSGDELGAGEAGKLRKSGQQLRGRA